MLSKEKGITLIALVITIIVMLILVIVTVNIAMNGDLFGKAKEGSEKTEKQAIYETIIGSTVLEKEGSNVGKIKVKDTSDAAKIALQNERKTVVTDPENVTDSTTEVTFEVTERTGTYYYKITGDEITIIDEPGDTPPDDTAWYILSTDEKNEIKTKSAQIVANGGEAIFDEVSYPMGEGMTMKGEEYAIAKYSNKPNYNDDDGIIIYTEMSYIVENGEETNTYISRTIQFKKFGYQAVGDDFVDFMLSMGASQQDIPSPRNVWSYNGVEYDVGACVTALYYFDSNEIYCQDYFNRIKAQFKNENEFAWYDIRKAEHDEIDNSNKFLDGIYVIASDRENFNAGEEGYHIIAHADRNYLAIDKVYIYYNGDEYIYLVSSGKWYKATQGNLYSSTAGLENDPNLENLTEATPQINKNIFTYIYSENYLNRLINSLGN